MILYRIANDYNLLLLLLLPIDHYKSVSMDCERLSKSATHHNTLKIN